MFGKEIKKARKYAGKTQKETSKITGIPQSTISWIENDKGTPNILQCYLLAKYYDISIDELIGRDIYIKY